jgi:hypothetical protein
MSKECIIENLSQCVVPMFLLCLKMMELGGCVFIVMLLTTLW